MKHLCDHTLWYHLLHGWLFWLLQRGYEQLSAIIMLMILLCKLATSRKQRRRGDVRHFQFGGVSKARVAAAVCTRHSRDALRWLKSHLDLRLLMCLELPKFGCRILICLKTARGELSSLTWFLFVDRVLVGTMKEGSKFQYFIINAIVANCWLKIWDLLYYWQLTWDLRLLYNW